MRTIKKIAKVPKMQKHITFAIATNNVENILIFWDIKKKASLLSVVPICNLRFTRYILKMTPYTNVLFNLSQPYFL